MRLEIETPYPARWVEGAREAQRRQTAHHRHFSEMKRSISPIDPVAVKVRMATQHRSEPQPKLSRPTLDLGADEDLGAALSEAVTPKQDPRPTRREREMARTERLERRHLRDDD